MAITVLNKQQDVDYLAKDFSSVIDDLTSFANVNYGPGTVKNRKWTNFNSASFSRTWLELLAYLSDILFFYFDTQATQSYLQSASVLSAVKDIAKQFGFVPATAQSASGDATFTVTSTVTIPRGFRVSSAGGVEFFVTNDLVCSSAGQYTTGVLQGSINTESFIALGIQSEEFDLAGPNVIIDLTNQNLFDITPQVAVNGNDYSLVDTFIWQNGTDTDVITDSLGEIIGGGGRAFQLLERANGTPYIRFGDGLFGRKLVKGDSISVTYRTGGGSQGNIEKNNLSSLLDSLTGVSSVINADDFSGGADEQSIEQLRDLIPASLRTLERAVSEQDYADLLKSKFTEVLDVSAELNTEEYGVDLSIYVVPQGSTITQITDNSLLYTKLTNYIDRRKTVTVQFQILDAYGVDTLVSLEVFLENTASKTSVSQSLQSVLLDYFDLQSGGPDENGVGFAEEILLKDIDTIVKTVNGIKRFEIKKLTYRPRIQMNIRGLITDYTASNVEVYDNVSESEWLLAASGIKETISSTIILSTVIDNIIAADIYVASGVDLSLVEVGMVIVLGDDLITSITDVDNGNHKMTVVSNSGLDIGDAITIRPVDVLFENEDSITAAVILDSSTDLVNHSGHQFKDGCLIKFLNISAGTGLVTGTTYYVINAVSGVSYQLSLTYNGSFIDILSNGTGTINFSTQFSYDLVTGRISYDSPVDLTGISPGDLFRNGPGQYEQTRVYTRGDSAGTKEKTKVVCIPDQNGLQEISQIVTRADVSGDLFQTFFIIYDRFGSVGIWFGSPSTPQPPMGTNRSLKVGISSGDSANTIATALAAVLNADSEFIAPFPATPGTVVVTNQSPGNVSDIVDGFLPTGFTLSTTRQGIDEDSLGSTYFNIYDNSKKVKVWFKIDIFDSPPSYNPVTERLIEVDIIENATATQVATALQAAMDADSQFSATISNDTVYIEDAVPEARTDASDSTDKPTGFTISVEVQGADSDSLESEYFILYDDLGSVAVWFSVDGSGTGPIGVYTHLLEVALVSADSASSVASKIATAINTDIYTSTKFTATYSSSNIVDISLDQIDPTFVTDGSSGTSGFTVTVLVQGSENDTDYTILGIDTTNSILYIDENLPVTEVGGINAGGSIRQGPTSYQEFKCFKKLNAIATNLAEDSITDSNISLAAFTGIAAVLSAHTLIDNTSTLIPNSFNTGEFYVVDGVGNIWDIVSNEDHTITTSVTAVNDPGISEVSSGVYKIIRKLAGEEVIFSGTIFTIDYNSDNTIYSEGAEFNQIGTIGDSFQLSELQTNRGKLGVAADIISYNNSTGKVVLNGNPDLSGVNTDSLLVDSTGEKFKVISSDNRALPTISYGTDNLEDGVVLTNGGANSQLSQGFKVDETAIYATVKPYLKRTGSFSGKLIAKIVEDDGLGLPDVSKLIALSSYISVSNIDDSDYETVVFYFSTPPSLQANVQYHLVVYGDSSYVANYAAGTQYVEWGMDDTSPIYADGNAETYDGIIWTTISSTDFIFEVSGTKSITIKSNLAPATGSGATVSQRYYDDNDEISLVLGISSGSVTGASDVNALGKGTVGALLDTKVDTFIFRTSPYADDIVNLRSNEIPELSSSDIVLSLYGGVA